MPPGRRRYTPRSQLRDPTRFLQETRRNLTASRGVAWRLFQRDFRSRYRLSVLGYVWVFIPPVATALVWIILNSDRVIKPGPVPVPYPVYVFAGTLMWQGFLDALNSPLRQLSSANFMFTKINFPTEAVLMAGLADTVVNALVRLVVIIPVFVYYRVPFHWTMVLVLPGLMALLLFGWGLGLVMAPFGLLYDDVPRAVFLATLFWFLVTPIAYATPPSTKILSFQILNPLTYLLGAPRDWLIGDLWWPGWTWFTGSAGSVVLVVVGWLLYRLSVPHLIDRMAA
jgi:lipopolysaccharide transport system permease protein